MTIKEMPWVRLEPIHRHKYGVLKAWVKGKSYKNGPPTSWSQIKWRPISGYASHRWRHLLGIGGRFATHVVDVLGWGRPCVNPRQFVQDVVEFNKEIVPMSQEEEEMNAGTTAQNEEEKVTVTVQDLEGFFPNIDLGEVENAVELALGEVQKMNAKWRYF